MLSSKKICCLVPARAGSKGLAHKNLSIIEGKSLVDIAVELGLHAGFEVAISTDITIVLKHYQGCEVHLRDRPAPLCGDDAIMQDVIADAITALGLEEHIIILLQPTSPLRTQDQLQCAVAKYHDEHPSLLLSVKETPSSVLKFYVKDDKGRAQAIHDEAYLFANRQALPPVYQPNGAFYIFAGDDFLANGFNTNDICLFEMDAFTSCDIDDASDLEKVRAYVSGSGA